MPALISDSGAYMLPTAAVVLFMAIIFVRAWWLRRASRSWPCVEGKVTSGRAKRVSTGRGGSLWFAELTYVFTTVEGDRYAGRYESVCKGEADAEAYARKMKDAKVSVRYKPGNPDTSLATLLKPTSWQAEAPAPHHSASLMKCEGPADVPAEPCGGRGPC